MSDELLGISLALVAAVAWGATSFFARVGLQNIHTTTGALVSLLAALLVVGAIAIPLHVGEMLALPLVAFGWLALLGFFNYPLGRLLNFTGIRLAGVARVAPIFATAPLWATAISIIFIGETPTVFTFVGTLAIVGGLGLIVSQRIVEE